MMTITIESAEAVQAGRYLHHMTISEIADEMMVSESTVRRALRRAGVTRRGRTVRGYAIIARHPTPIAVSYSDGPAPA